jgi:DNA-binding response OmpR family regulator
MSDAGFALVVEDEPANQDFFVRLITQAGFSVQGATTAAEALDIAKNQADLRLAAVDLQLPDMPGLDLIRELRDLLPEALLVVLTMWDEPSMITEAFNNGCDVFLVKPHGFMELYQRLKGLPDTRPDLCRAIIDQYGLRPYTGPISEKEPEAQEASDAS